MKPDDTRKLYRAESAATSREAAQTAREVATNPEAARQLWGVVCAMAPTDAEFALLLQAVIQSVMIDSIHNNMQRSDEYALVIGRRITTLMEAMKPGSLQRGKSVKSP